MIQRLTCHCERVELAVTLKHGLGDARRCDCSFCRRRGAASATVAIGDLQIVKGKEHLSEYQWGTKTARHFFCAHCGIYTHHQRRMEPREYGVNVGGLDGVNPRDLGDIPWVDGVNHPSDQK